jgi:hypothetical protein
MDKKFKTDWLFGSLCLSPESIEFLCDLCFGEMWEILCLGEMCELLWLGEMCELCFGELYDTFFGDWLKLCLFISRFFTDWLATDLTDPDLGEFWEYY